MKNDNPAPICPAECDPADYEKKRQEWASNATALQLSRHVCELLRHAQDEGEADAYVNSCYAMDELQRRAEKATRNPPTLEELHSIAIAVRGDRYRKREARMQEMRDNGEGDDYANDKRIEALNDEISDLDNVVLHAQRATSITDLDD